MSLTMRTVRSGSQVTRYEFVGGGPERATQIAVLTTALASLIPISTHDERTLIARQAMAALSLQLAGLLDGWDGDRTPALSVISSIRSYLKHQHLRTLQASGPDAASQLIRGYAYFEFDWSRLEV